MAWIDVTYSDSGNQTIFAQVQSDMITLKCLGFTTVLYLDYPLDQAAHDDDPGLYTTTTLLQICQQYGLYVILVSENQAWTSISSALAGHLQALANCYKNYSNLVGLYFDDWYNGAGTYREPADPVAFDDFVRQNFNIGRDYYTNYGFYDCLNSGQLKGKSLVSLCSDMYWTSQGAPNWSDPSGVQWLQNMYNKYNDAYAYPYYTIGPIFDCSGEGGSDLHNAWSAQANFCIQKNMLVYQWYCWKRLSGDIYGPGFYAHPDWWSTIKQVNQQILLHLQNASIPGDINGDGNVNLQDLVLLAKAYGSTPSASNWNPNADIDGDGKVSLSDLVILAQHYGQHYP